MCRPSLGTMTRVTLLLGFSERIDAVAGPNRRAEFMRDVTVAGLERREAAPVTGPQPPAKRHSR